MFLNLFLIHKQKQLIPLVRIKFSFFDDDDEIDFDVVDVDDADDVDDHDDVEEDEVCKCCLLVCKYFLYFSKQENNSLIIKKIHIQKFFVID